MSEAGECLVGNVDSCLLIWILNDYRSVSATRSGSFLSLGVEGSKILLLGRGCCLCAWWVSWDEWRRQQNPASDACVLPLRLVGFLGSMAKAAKSCFQGACAAFALGGFHWVCGRGSKILLQRRGCCLWSWWVSLGLWRRQQNPASQVRLLPLRLVGFLGSMAKAAKSCFRDEFAAFDLGGFHRVFGGGSKILLQRRGSCLCAWWVSWDFWRRQQILVFEASLLPLCLVGFLGLMTKAADMLESKISAAL